MTSERDPSKKNCIGCGECSPVKSCVLPANRSKSNSGRKTNENVQVEMQQRMASLEKLLYDLIVTQSRRERVLINQIAKLRGELERRSKAFHYTLSEYKNRLKMQQPQQVNTPDNVLSEMAKETELSLTDGNVFGASTSVKCSSSGGADVLEDEPQKYEIEYEEAALDKLDSNAHLGIAFCCEDENETDSFGEDVDSVNLAGRDERISSGDEIIEIDGIDIQTRLQAFQLLSDEKCTARSRLKLERDLTSQNVSVNECKKSIYSTDLSYDRTLLTLFQDQSILEENEEEDEEESVVNDVDDTNQLKPETLETVNAEDESSGIEKDSGMDKTDDSIRNEDSSEQESSQDAHFIETQKKVLNLAEEKQRIQITMNKSEAVEMWVESTASPRHAPGDELCLETFLPPPPCTEYDSDVNNIVSCENCRQCSCIFSTCQLKELNRHEQISSTIKLKRHLSSRVKKESCAQLQQQLGTNSLSSNSMKLEPSLEWRVKQRADGSRFIVRRPARVKLLKERATQVAEERSGLTTDDDAMSEFKGGRYWTKEERKKHLDRQKVRQRQKEGQLHTHNCRTNANESLKHNDILELSRRKMMRVKDQGMLDNFTTVQELMAHGSHSKHNNKIPHRLLAVTTV